MTDNKNLLFNGPVSKRLNRMKFIMEKFDYELRHISGTNNSETDLLSSFFCRIKPIDDFEYYRPALPAKLLKLKQHLSNRICERKNDLITSLKLIHNELLHIGITKFKNCRPFKQREDVLTTSKHSQFDTSSNVCNLINLQNKSGSVLT
ncbi:hypothetical protein DMUE_4065 [Dictyocoela muelleri]|nr:hypothetical protein DMUE_4065 [Dictyocoela muelleri]